MEPTAADYALSYLIVSLVFLFLALRNLKSCGYGASSETVNRKLPTGGSGAAPSSPPLQPHPAPPEIRPGAGEALE